MAKASSLNTLPLIDRTQSPPCKTIAYLDIATFKINPCSIKVPHNHKQCQFFHYPKDRKRPGEFYSSDLCPFVEREEQCPYGDSCPKAHSRVEQLYSPIKYKSRFCSFYPNNLQSCEYGDYCSFAHHEHEISIPLIHHFEFDEDFFLFHYKTVMCPFNQSKHDKSSCVYAHNWQDFRRKPQELRYDPIPCQNWKTGDFVTNYEESCVNGFECTKCHGWKEFDFHPLNWMTKPCPKGKNCGKKGDCTFFHNNAEKRDIQQAVQFKIFRLVPRNRVVRNSFKGSDSFTLGSGPARSSHWESEGLANAKTATLQPDIFENMGMSGNTSGNTWNTTQLPGMMNFSWQKGFPLNSNSDFPSFHFEDGSSFNFNPEVLSRMQFSTRSDNHPHPELLAQNPAKKSSLKATAEFQLPQSPALNPQNLSLFDYPNWKQPGFLPAPIEESENDGNLTPHSIKVNFKGSSNDLPQLTHINSDSNLENLAAWPSMDLHPLCKSYSVPENQYYPKGLLPPPPYQLSLKKRDFAEKSRFVSGFAKDDEEAVIGKMEEMSLQQKK